MGKKIMNVFLFLAVVAAAIGMTVYVGKGAAGVQIYNFVFLGTMAVIYLAGMIGGMFRMNELGEALGEGTQELTGIYKVPGKADIAGLSYLQGIFNHKYLDNKIDNFIGSIDKSQEGIGDIEEYINEDEVDLHVHKRLLEMVPDILTSLGILGTFVGLVWGLKNFEPSNYEAMTSSVTSLVEGIKVAFLTSIYGIALSIVYSVGMKSEYSYMMEKLQDFLEKFHVYVLPTAENESRNLLVSSQKTQTEAMKQMAEQFSVQMADSFEKIITPTFQKMNDSLDMLVGSVTRCQKDAVKDILDTFMEEMHGSFQMQFGDFNEALAELKKAQKENAEYTTTLYQTMSQQLSDSYVKQDKAMKSLITELGSMQKNYMATATKIVKDNQEIQKMQQQDYQRITDYLREAEKSSAKFWVACNQTMQKYLETAAQGMEKAGNANQLSADLVKSNKRIVQEFDVKMQEFVEYQKLAYHTMEQVRRLLADISAEGKDKNVYLTGGRFAGTQTLNAEKESMEKMQEILKSQGERQQALLEEMSQNVKDLSKAAQKGKFSLFR